MEASGGRPDQVGEPPFDVHVQVLEAGIPRKISALDFVLHPAQAGDDAVGIVLGDDALLGQHGSVGR